MTYSQPGEAYPQPGSTVQQPEPPVGEPLKGASLKQATSRFFRGYFTFRGRASRSEAWWPFLFVGIAQFFLSTMIAISTASTLTPEQLSELGIDVSDADAGTGPRSLFDPLTWVMIGFTLAILLPLLSVMWRRLQDAGFHGALSLLTLLPSAVIIPLIACALPTSHKAKRYGPGATPPPPPSTLGRPPSF